MRSLHTGVGERGGTAGGMRVAFVVSDGRFNGRGRGGDGGYDTARGAECGAAGERERKKERNNLLVVWTWRCCR